MGARLIETIKGTMLTTRSILISELHDVALMVNVRTVIGKRILLNWARS